MIFSHNPLLTILVSVQLIARLRANVNVGIMPRTSPLVHGSVHCGGKLKSAEYHDYFDFSVAATGRGPPIYGGFHRNNVTRHSRCYKIVFGFWINYNSQTASG